MSIRIGIALKELTRQVGKPVVLDIYTITRFDFKKPNGLLMHKYQISKQRIRYNRDYDMAQNTTQNYIYEGIRSYTYVTPKC